MEEETEKARFHGGACLGAVSLRLRVERRNHANAGLADPCAQPDAQRVPGSDTHANPAADRDYADVSQTAAEYAELLQSTMEAHGFLGYFSEWWHYSDCDVYPVHEQAIQ